MERMQSDMSKTKEKQLANVSKLLQEDFACRVEVDPYQQTGPYPQYRSSPSVLFKTEMESMQSETLKMKELLTTVSQLLQEDLAHRTQADSHKKTGPHPQHKSSGHRAPVKEAISPDDHEDYDSGYESVTGHRDRIRRPHQEKRPVRSILKKPSSSNQESKKETRRVRFQLETKSPSRRTVKNLRQGNSLPNWQNIVGEVCFQLNCSILMHIFGIHFQTLGCTVKNINQKIKELTFDSFNQHVYSEQRNLLKQRYTDVLNRMQECGYKPQVHPDFCENAVSTYGRLKYSEHFALNDYNSLYNAISRIGPADIQAECLILLDCLNCLAMDANSLLLW
ncbi:speriolin-like [Protopterus annectens]|uniref:speriolin-like n=1 Tax=Protopterus annectens TaxID=7888 RepID=UPI001CFB9355|nr:speriolin-like [Protopterus annectens]